MCHINFEGGRELQEGDQGPRTCDRHQLALDDLTEQEDCTFQKERDSPKDLLIVLLCFCSHSIFLFMIFSALWLFGCSFICVSVPLEFSVYLNLLTALCLFLFSLEGCQQWNRYDYTKAALHFKYSYLRGLKIKMRNRLCGSGNELKYLLLIQVFIS